MQIRIKDDREGTVTDMQHGTNGGHSREQQLKWRSSGRVCEWLWGRGAVDSRQPVKGPQHRPPGPSRDVAFANTPHRVNECGGDNTPHIAQASEGALRTPHPVRAGPARPAPRREGELLGPCSGQQG